MPAQRCGGYLIAKSGGNFPAQLSGVQQQRVAIARGLCMRPKIMLFEDPTSTLDLEMINEVLDVMRDLAKGGNDHDGRHPRDGVRPGGGKSGRLYG
jgi:ABC-type histidine transport system ATPase subunit